MDAEQAVRKAAPVCSDEIDLVELFQNLWRQKVLIIASTVVFTLIATAIAFLITPEFEAKASVLPPRLSDIAPYNLGRGEAGLSQFSVSDIYSRFKTNLLSGSLGRTFFYDTYLPVLEADKRAKAKDKLWEEFNEILTVKAPNKQRPDLYEVMVEYERPELVAEWVSLYIDMAAKKTEKDVQKKMRTEIDLKIQVIEKQIDASRTSAQKRREDRIIRLRDALVVAEAVGLDAPQVVDRKVSMDGDLSQFIDGNLLYMIGAKAIKAELTVLEKRENDDPFIGELRGLENQLDFLKKIDVTPDDASVFTLNSSAEVPETPVKPKKVIIIVVGFMFGGILGVSAAVVRSMVMKRKVKID